MHNCASLRCEIHRSALVHELFGLNSSWWHRKMWGILENVARVVFHTSATKTIRSSYHRLTSPAHIAELLKMLMDTTWPNGVVRAPFELWHSPVTAC